MSIRDEVGVGLSIVISIALIGICLWLMLLALVVADWVLR